jgi:hypothetical protein
MGSLCIGEGECHDCAAYTGTMSCCTYGECENVICHECNLHTCALCGDNLSRCPTCPLQDSRCDVCDYYICGHCDPDPELVACSECVRTACQECESAAASQGTHSCGCALDASGEVNW